MARRTAQAVVGAGVCGVVDELESVLVAGCLEDVYCVPVEWKAQVVCDPLRISFQTVCHQAHIPSIKLLFELDDIFPCGLCLSPLA